MTIEIKDGDLYSYATIYVETHGFIIRTNHDFMHEVQLSDWLGVELTGTHSSSTPNVSVPIGDVNKMVWDDRGRNPRTNAFIMVYRSGKTEFEVLEMIRPQLREHLQKLTAMYELLTANASEMAEVLVVPRTEADYLCSTSPMYNK